MRSVGDLPRVLPSGSTDSYTVVGADRIARNGDTANKVRDCSQCVLVSHRLTVNAYRSERTTPLFSLPGIKSRLSSSRQSPPWIWISLTGLGEFNGFLGVQTYRSTDSMLSIPIEHRPPLEACLVRGALYPFTEGREAEIAQIMITPPDLKGVYNPSFDVTPAELITAIVTEKVRSVLLDFFSLHQLSMGFSRVLRRGGLARLRLI